MRKLIIIAATIIALLAMSAPAMAAFDTNAVVGSGVAVAPYMVLETMTPDDTIGDGVQIDPEFAIPTAGLFTSLSAGSDGWKPVNFYVEVGYINGISNIDSVAIDVYYPGIGQYDAQEAALFGNRATTLKFEINAYRDGQSETGWGASITNPYAASEVYPDGTVATYPQLKVRDLVYGVTTGPHVDIVDVNADGVRDGLPDQNWHDFLTTWGTNRIKYADSFTATTAFDLYQTGQALVLEITGYMWFHQPGLHYIVSAKAAVGGAWSLPVFDALTEPNNIIFNYNDVVGLYTDFNSINYGIVDVGGTGWNQGDRNLATLGLSTVWNNGNASAQLSVESTRMVKHIVGDTSWNSLSTIKGGIYYTNNAKTIQHFDAQLYYCDGAGNVVQHGTIEYANDTPTVITNPGETNGNPVLLQSCRPAKIEFSVHPESGEGQESGIYSGFLTLTVNPYTGTQLPLN